MAGNNQNAVERVGQLGVAFVHCFSETGAVERHTIAVSAVIEILHAVAFGKFVVPGVFYRFAVVAHIAVAEHGNTFSFEQRLSRQRAGAHGDKNQRNYIFHLFKVDMIRVVCRLAGSAQGSSWLRSTADRCGRSLE